jgi:hypothetical protein
LKFSSGIVPPEKLSGPYFGNPQSDWGLDSCQVSVSVWEIARRWKDSHHLAAVAETNVMGLRHPERAGASGEEDLKIGVADIDVDGVLKPVRDLTNRSTLAFPV